MMENKKILGFNKNVFFAGLVSFFMDISSEMIYPVVPLFLTNVLGVNKSVIGLIEGIAEATASLLKGFSGWISDKMSMRKPLMIIGYGISVISRPVIVLAANWYSVLIARFVDRTGKGIRTAPRDTIIAESADKEYYARAFGFHRAMDTMGAVIGPFLAFLFLALSSNNYRLVFLLSIIPGIIAVAIIILFITEKKNKKQEESKKVRLTFKIFNWKFKYFILIITLFSFGNSSDAFLILRAENVGLKPEIIPVAYLLFNLVYCLFSYPAGIIADKFGKKRVILSGFILFAIVYFGFAIVKKPIIIWVLFCLYGIYMGLTEGIQKGFLSTMLPEDYKATAFGIYNMAIGVSVLPASLIGGWLWEHISPSATFYFGVSTAFLASVLFFLYMLKYRKENCILKLV